MARTFKIHKRRNKRKSNKQRKKRSVKKLIGGNPESCVKKNGTNFYVKTNKSNANLCVTKENSGLYTSYKPHRTANLVNKPVELSIVFPTNRSSRLSIALNMIKYEYKNIYGRFQTGTNELAKAKNRTNIDDKQIIDMLEQIKGFDEESVEVISLVNKMIKEPETVVDYERIAEFIYNLNNNKPNKRMKGISSLSTRKNRGSTKRRPLSKKQLNIVFK
jgi:hypothetical protein